MTKKVIHVASKSGLTYDLQIVYRYTRLNIKFECFTVIEWPSDTIDRAFYETKIGFMLQTQTL